MTGLVKVGNMSKCKDECVTIQLVNALWVSCHGNNEIYDSELVSAITVSLEYLSAEL